MPLDDFLNGMMRLGVAAIATISAIVLISHVCWRLLFSPLAKLPGPKQFALTGLRLAKEDLYGTRTRTIHHLHQEYGPVVRVGPNEVSFNSLTALRLIYGAGSSFGRRPSFSPMFDGTGGPHLFTFYSSADHAARKKLMSQLYSKSNVLKNPIADSIQAKTMEFIKLVESDPQTASDLVKSLHFFSLDNITWRTFGIVEARLLWWGMWRTDESSSDIHEPTTRRYSWFQIHLPRYTNLAMACGSSLRAILDVLGILPGRVPVAYSGLQKYALTTFNTLREDKGLMPKCDGNLMVRLLYEQGRRSGKISISNKDMAAECADHLDAGLKTTSDTLMLAVLSLPKNRHHQKRLIAEVIDAASFLDSDEYTLPVEMCDRLPFLDAVIKETLRLYALIPASQPRVSTRDVLIDGYHIPARKIVSCQSFSLHRNSGVFPDANSFKPNRWLGGDEETAEMRRWWWPFSSGGRMCLGMQ